MTVRVYGRIDYAEPLVELGSADATSDAGEAYGGDWLELVAFPEGAIHWIIREGERVDDA